MLRTETRFQPDSGTIAELLHAAAADRAFDTLDASVAYITAGGLDALRRGHEADVDRLRRRWLSSFDWCRSDSVALDALDAAARSSVKIFDGATVVTRVGCPPRVPFHPKGFIFTGKDAALLVSGSGNLSRSGITRGVELNTILEVRNPATKQEHAAWNAIMDAHSWFTTAWSSASRYAPLAGAYRTARAHAPSVPPVTDDDWTPAGGSRRGFSSIELTAISRASIFWVQAGNLTANLGPGNPGNQLMTKAQTRVFFGFVAEELPRKTQVGEIDVRYNGVIVRDLTIQYAHNGMDRINLPRPGTVGPAKYDQETLVFEKISYQGSTVYDLRLATTAEARALARRSKASLTSFTMATKDRRQFGFCFP